MPDREHRDGLVPALLRHWRRQRGLSQLDLALAAGVSSRHVSFLETGRSRPSPEMVLLLGATLGVSLRQVNTMLRAAGHDPVYDEDEGALAPSVVEALDLLAEHHEPYPLLVVDRTYDLRRANRGASALLGLLGVDLGPGGDSGLPGGPARPNLARLTFDPEGARPVIANFSEVGRQLLWRIQREVLADPDDGEMAALLDDLLAMPTVDPDWRQVDLSAPSDPALVLHLAAGGAELRFLTTVTAFQAPQNVAVEQLRIETWFPYDAPTSEWCRALAG